MLAEATPRKLVHDLYRLQKEHSQASVRVIRAIGFDEKQVDAMRAERDGFAESQKQIRNYLRQSQERVE